MTTIGTKIAELRKIKGMTQEEFAGILGVSAQSVSKWENSVTMPDVLLLPLIADPLGITIDALFREPAPYARGLRFSEVPETAHEAIVRAAAEAFVKAENENCTEEEISKFAEKPPDTPAKAAASPAIG